MPPPSRRAAAPRRSPSANSGRDRSPADAPAACGAHVVGAQRRPGRGPALNGGAFPASGDLVQLRHVVHDARPSCSTSVVDARPRVPPAPPAGPRAARPPARCSCALPLAFEAGVGHEQLLDADLFVVERDRHLEVPSGAGQPLDRCRCRTGGAGPARPSRSAGCPATPPRARRRRPRRRGRQEALDPHRRVRAAAPAAASCPAVMPPPWRPPKCQRGPPFLDQLRRQRLEEARRMRVPQLAAPPAGPGPGEVQLVLGPGEPDVAEPALLLEPVRPAPRRAPAGRARPRARPAPRRGHSSPLAVCSVISVTPSSAPAIESLPELAAPPRPGSARAACRPPRRRGHHLRPVRRRSPPVRARSPSGRRPRVPPASSTCSYSMASISSLQHVGRRPGAPACAARAVDELRRTCEQRRAHVGPELGHPVGDRGPSRAAACFHWRADLA